VPRSLRRTAVVAGFALVALAFTLVAAQADTTSDGGALDPTFGTGGITTAAISQFGATSGELDAVAVQPDGKVLIGGYLRFPPLDATHFAIARYLPDGSPDPSWGTDGLVTTSVPSPWAGENGSQITNILVEPDGKILAVGYLTQSEWLAMARYNPDGSLDTSFGWNGTIPDPNLVDPSASLLAGVTAAALQPDGKILVLNGGYLWRYNADGRSPDQTFGNGGSIPADGGSIAFAPDGSILVAGTDVQWLNSDQFTTSWRVQRFTADGLADPSFGSDGVSIIPDGGAAAMAVQSDGKIVLADEYDPSTCCDQSSARMIRLNPDGTLDTSFGTNGVVITTPANKTGGNPALLSADQVAVQTDGKIIALGEEGLAPASAGTGFGLERFLPDGTPDPSFGINGVAGVSFGSSYDASVSAALLQSDGKILAVGNGQPASPPPDGSPSPLSWLMMRYLPDASAPLAVTTAGSGSGTVDSQPLGINCDGTVNCAAQFAAQSQVTLTARPIGGAGVSWSGACAGQGPVCTLTMNQASDVKVTFSLCDVPRVKDKTLSSATRALHHADCSLGRVSRTASKTIARGRVISQTPAAGIRLKPGARVRLTVSNGKPR
jgi:uncharacterized delta-60 repeat protein